jgi:hypothetical protein
LPVGLGYDRETELIGGLEQGRGMKRQDRFRVNCRSCKTRFIMKVPEGKDFGELNYQLYGRRPLVCPKCGLEEHSDYDHHGCRYYFRNFDNLGRIVKPEPIPDAQETEDKDSSGAKQE